MDIVRPKRKLRKVGFNRQASEPCDLNLLLSKDYSERVRRYSDSDVCPVILPLDTLPSTLPIDKTASLEKEDIEHGILEEEIGLLSTVSNSSDSGLVFHGKVKTSRGLIAIYLVLC